jgi:hypothetical protein
MTRLTESIRTRLMLIHGFTMLALGVGLFYIRGMMTNLFSEIIGGAFALLLVAASLLFIAGLDWLCAVRLGRRYLSRLRRFLFLNTAAAACSVFLVFYPNSSIRLLCYALAVYALSLSLAKFGLAKPWAGAKREQVIMYILAGGGLAFSAILIAFAGQDDRNALAVIASYSLFIGFQMLLTMYLLQQKHVLKLVAPASKLNQPSARGTLIRG